MKIHRLFAVIFMSGIFILSACEGGTVPATQTQVRTPPTSTGIQDQTEKQIETQQRGMMGQEPSIITQVAELNPTYTHFLYTNIPSGIEDSKFTPEVEILYTTAVASRDASYCDKFPQDLIQICKTDIQDLENIIKANITSDIAICDKILKKDRANLCKLSVQKIIAISDNNAPTEEEYAIMDEAVAKNDINLCDKITNTNFRDNCMTNVISYNKK